ncbi:hypothetical protein KP509_01G122800 [Ceratopteris richardii]|uniref:Uncharacterized protein n=1 Tax=Ceratopteris richardii TaxID=49495 RepID=A0A8T2VH39_CERRI|nr:hypothetical protein KP509_01G122800 [Ceratopteris richardii]
MFHWPNNIFLGHFRLHYLQLCSDSLLSNGGVETTTNIDLWQSKDAMRGGGCGLFSLPLGISMSYFTKERGCRKNRNGGCSKRRDENCRFCPVLE